MITGWGKLSRLGTRPAWTLQRRRAMPRKPVKRSCNPSQISTLERSEIVGYQGRIVSRLVLISDGKLRAWMARLAGSDLPKGKESQPELCAYGADHMS